MTKTGWIALCGLGFLLLAGGQSWIRLATGWESAGKRSDPKTEISVQIDRLEERRLRQQVAGNFRHLADLASARAGKGSHDEAGAAELRAILVDWAEEDLSGMASWLRVHEDELSQSYNWLGDVLLGLAASQPVKAFEYGTALNEANLETYDVPPTTLLAIALKYLSADEAIRVMDGEQRGQRPYTVSRNHEFSQDMDFGKLGRYIVERTGTQPPYGWDVNALPENLIGEWIKRDRAGALEFTREMAVKASSTSYPYSFTEYALGMAEILPEAESVEMLRELLSGREKHVSTNELAEKFIMTGRSGTLLTAAEGLPLKLRDEMARGSYIMAAMEARSGAVDYRADALRLFDTSEGRVEAVGIMLRAGFAKMSDTGDLLRELGHSVGEIADLERLVK